MTYRKTKDPSKAFQALGDFIKRVTHEVPTGPHTDMRRRKINPSFKKRLTGIRKKNLPPKLPKALKDTLKKK